MIYIDTFKFFPWAVSCEGRPSSQLYLGEGGAKKGGTIIPVCKILLQCAFLLPNCEGLHSVRLFYTEHCSQYYSSDKKYKYKYY